MSSFVVRFVASFVPSRWLFLCALCSGAPSALLAQKLTLQQAIDLAQKQSFQAQAANASLVAARARGHAFSMRLLPQITLNGNAPIYDRAIQPVTQPDGSTLFTPIEQKTANAGLTIAQKLPFTGGTLSVTSLLQRYQRTGGTAASTETWSSSPVIFSLSQPILRPNTTRWDWRESDMRVDEAESEYLEAREGVALGVTNAFFDFYVAKRTLENATLNAAVNDTLYTINKGRLEIGKIGENDLLQSELALLRTRTALDQAKFDYDRTLAALRLALNLPADANVDVDASTTIPRIDADTAVAVAQAMRNRASVRTLDLQTLQAKRRVTEAKLTSSPGATINASVGFNQTANEMNLAYQNLLQQQRFSLGVSIPLIQWGARRADVQAALADQQRTDATVRIGREQIAQEAHFAAIQLGLAKRNLDVSAKADTVAAKRFEVAYNRYVIGKIGIDNLYIAQNEKDQAVTQYLQALRGYWTAYYKLRQVTLYDFESGAPIK